MKKTNAYFSLSLILLYAAAALAIIYYRATADIGLWPLVLMTAAWIFLLRKLSPPSSAWVDAVNMAILVWIFYPHANKQFALCLLMPLVTVLFLTWGYQASSLRHARLTAVLALAWIAAAIKIFATVLSWGLLFPLLASLAMLGIYLALRPGKNSAEIKSVDIIACSYSGNTAHFADIFIEEVKRNNAQVIYHRFHYHKTFRAELKAEGLVVAFPVIGWKAPWPFLNYLLFHLPRGRGKPAYILYTCAGGPENAGILTGLILAIKGYRLRGLNWAMYPLNLPTMRLGPSRWWKFLDSLMPSSQSLELQKEYGRDFIQGKSRGLPVIFSPTALFGFGILADNVIVDSLLCHNHVFKKRCSRCHLCVAYCPTQRLKLKNGYPYSWGSCALCFACVNICPNKAMHIWCFSEYGNAYRPKWQDKIISKSS